jgi:hypothetical protein
VTAPAPCGGCVEATLLELGARGAFEKRPFELVASVHVVSRAGGHWHEWRAALDGGGEAWLAEASGAFYWMHEGALAPWDEATVGAPFAADFVVVERGEATRVRTTGDVAAASGEAYRYVDLSGRDGAFASIDYGDDPAVVARTFVGRRVTLAELGLTPRRGTRSFLRAVGRDFTPFVDPGTKVSFDGASFTVLGALARSGHEKGNETNRWRWEEYLLWHPTTGIRWLVLADGHWNLATPIDAGSVRVHELGCSYRGETFRPLGEGVARIDAATGQFPWEVRVGEEAATTDWVHVPNMLSRETTDAEVAWSLLTYLDPKRAARALGVSDLPRRHGRAPNQPKRRGED